MDTTEVQAQFEESNIDYEYLFWEDDSSRKWNDKIKPYMIDTTYYDSDDKEGHFEEKELFCSIIEMILKSAGIVTVIVESNHIDSDYTDTYYNYFSGLHFQPIKYCKRFSFFQGKILPQWFLEEELHKNLQNQLIGTMVIRPLKYGFIGRTLLDPVKIRKSSSENNIYLRTATFRQHILGVEFTIDAFPFCSQDSSFMTCAEITVLNLMEYYAMRYHSYKSILPSDIKKLSQEYQYERVTPSEGLNYLVVSKILSEFGFSPRIYNRESIKIYPLVGDDRENEIKRIMHYYVESGIPVAVNVEPDKGDFRGGHSLLCIGHSGELEKKRAKRYAMRRMQDEHELINSADFYTKYCVIDDHQRPYEARRYEQISTFKKMKISNLAVPLYKKMYLEAKYAYDIFYQIFHDVTLGLTSWNIPEEYLGGNEAVVMRIYQASSRNYKAFKIDAYDNGHFSRKNEIALLELPQFVWCCEFFSYSQYMNEDRRAFANIILDATASPKQDYIGAVIAIETVDKIFKKEKSELNGLAEFSLSDEGIQLLPVYNRNLRKY